MTYWCYLPCIVALLVLPTAQNQTGILLLQAEKNERKFQSVPGCWLGNDFHMLGDKWSPVIQPYGRMACVKCQCARVVRKGVLQQEGMVVCRNIKRECPDVNCRKPVIRPATCCKVCPFSDNVFWEDNYNLLQEDDVTSVSKYEIDNEVINPDMSALLVGGNVIRRHSSRKTRAAAIVHVTFISHNAFQYAVRYARLKGPRLIQLTDEYGTVFLERPIPDTDRGRGKICGVWNNIPPVYIQYILQARMVVTITTKRQKKGEISGRLLVETLPEKGTFEAILTSPVKTGIGGTAVLYYDVISRSASYIIKVEGHMGKAGSNEYFVTMEKDTEIVYQDILRMSTANKLVGKLKFDNRMSKRMARGRLKLRVTARSGETILGTLAPRLTCKSRLGIIKAGRSNNDKGRGFIAVQLHENGTLHYKAMLNNVTSVTRLTLERYMPRLERWKTMATLTHAYQHDMTSNTGQAIGMHTKLRAIDVVALQDGQIRVAMETRSRDVVYAELLAVPYMQAIDIFTDIPVYLTSNDCDVDFYAWLQIDRACALNYYITTSASVDIFTWPPTKYNFEATLHASTSGYDYPILYDVNSTDVQIRDMYGTVEDVSADLLQDLDFGEAVLKIEVTDTRGCDNLQAKIYRSNICWGPKVGEDTNRLSNDVDENGVFRCYYEGQMYRHGESWLPEASYPCHTCRCERGNARCDRVLCPPVSCAHPVKHEDQCCPMCEDDNSTEKRHQGSCYYHGDKRWHPVGTYWHPYVPPFGYAKCAICNCLPDSAEVNCTRMPCPKLPCLRSQRVRVNREDCCQICVEAATAPAQTTISPIFLQDGDIDHKDCKVGQDTYTSGATWHPHVAPFGEMKCYTCRCRRGKVRCKKKICKKLKCKRRHRRSGECCPICYHEKNLFTRKSRHKKSKKKSDIFT